MIPSKKRKEEAEKIVRELGEPVEVTEAITDLGGEILKGWKCRYCGRWLSHWWKRLNCKGPAYCLGARARRWVAQSTK